MPGEDQEPTLRDIIEEHLKRQDKQTRRMVYFNGAVWGGSITFGALFLWISRLAGLSFIVNYAVCLAAGFIFTAYCWYKMRKIK